jgi:hypothetical protein
MGSAKRLGHRELLAAALAGLTCWLRRPACSRASERGTHRTDGIASVLTGSGDIDWEPTSMVSPGNSGD